MELKPTMHRLRPFLGRVTVIESSVDQEQRDSGLIVPISGDELGPKLRRGVVLHTSGLGLELDSGTVIYFRGGVTIGDVIVVDLNDIVAYMEEEQ